MGVLIENLIQQFADVQVGKIWVGENMHYMLGSVTDDYAFIRPSPEMHSVAEVVNHLTVWRRETIIKLRTGAGNLRQNAPINWLSNGQLERIGWKQLREDYQNSLIELIELIKHKDDSFLQEMYYDGEFEGYHPYSFALQGMLHHDIYHSGQLELIVNALHGASLRKKVVGM